MRVSKKHIKFEYEIQQYQLYYPTHRSHSLKRKTFSKSYLTDYDGVVKYLTSFLGGMNALSYLTQGWLTKKYNNYSGEYEYRKFTFYIALLDVYVEIIKHRVGALNPDTFVEKLMEDCNEAYYKAHNR